MSTWMHGHTGRYTNRQADRWMHAGTERQMPGQMHGGTERAIQTDIQTDGRRMDGHRGSGWTDKRTDGHTDAQAD